MSCCESGVEKVLDLVEVSSLYSFLLLIIERAIVPATYAHFMRCPLSALPFSSSFAFYKYRYLIHEKIMCWLAAIFFYLSAVVTNEIIWR